MKRGPANRAANQNAGRGGRRRGRIIADDRQTCCERCTEKPRGAAGVRRGERAMHASQAPKSVTMPTRNKKRRGVSDDASWRGG